MGSVGSLASSQAQLAHQGNMAVVKKSQDIAKSQGEAAVGLLQQAVELQQQMAPVAEGKGLLVDVLA